MERAKGIDVSHHQGIIDWHRLADEGEQFAYVRASYLGTSNTEGADSFFVRNWNGARAAGLIVGVYHYYVPQPRHTQQIDYLLRVLGDRLPDLPVALDFEEARQGWTRTQITRCIEEAVFYLQQKLGYFPMIYTSKGWWDSNVLDSYVWAQCPLWVANWQNPTGPVLPRHWKTWMIWQYTSSGKSGAVQSARLDRNWYNGTVDQLIEAVTKG